VDAEGENKKVEILFSLLKLYRESRVRTLTEE
jgi:hypothetical protein